MLKIILVNIQHFGLALYRLATYRRVAAAATFLSSELLTPESSIHPGKAS